MFLRQAIRQLQPRLRALALARGAAAPPAVAAARGVAPLVAAIAAAGGGAAYCLSLDEWAARTSPVEAELARDGWSRADAPYVKSGDAATNAIYGALGAQSDALKIHKIFAKPDGSVCALATFNENSAGHPGVVRATASEL